MKIYKYFVSIDDYIRNINEFNISLAALKHHDIPYNLFVSIRSPFKWYINIDNIPIMRFFELATKGQRKFLVSINKPLSDSDINKLKRRNFNNSLESLKPFIMNDVFTDCIDNYACVFKYGSEQQLINISKKLNTKIYMLEAYRANMKLAICFNKYILSVIDYDNIIVTKDKGEMNKPGEFESYINYNGLLNKTFILKYTKTDYFNNGKKYIELKHIKEEKENYEFEL